MDGLDDQAEAVVEGIIEQLYSNEVVKIKHSSRDSLMFRITQAINEHPNRITCKRLILRSGISMAGLRSLEDALTNLKRVHDDNNNNTSRQYETGTTTSTKNSNNNNNNNNGNDTFFLEELEFVGLNTIEKLERAILCTRRLEIPRLSLTTYGARLLRANQDLVATTIRSALLQPLSLINNDFDNNNNNNNNDNDGGDGGDIRRIQSTQTNALSVSNNNNSNNNNKNNNIETTHLKYLAISSYPIGSCGADGVRILAEAISHYKSSLEEFNLVDCDIRSDCATALADIIRTNPNLIRMDLSYNRHFPGLDLNHDMTMKTMVRRGLIHNLTLLEFKMDPTKTISRNSRGSTIASTGTVTTTGSGGPVIKRHKIDQQLRINRLRTKYLSCQYDIMSVHPHTYSHLLAKVSAKPSAIYFFLQESIPILF